MTSLNELLIWAGLAIMTASALFLTTTPWALVPLWLGFGLLAIGWRRSWL